MIKALKRLFGTEPQPEPQSEPLFSWHGDKLFVVSDLPHKYVEPGGTHPDRPGEVCVNSVVFNDRLGTFTNVCKFAKLFTIDVTAGNLRIESPHNIGQGTKVWLDGVELQMVKRIELTIDAEQITTARVTYLMRGEDLGTGDE